MRQHAHTTVLHHPFILALCLALAPNLCAGQPHPTPSAEDDPIDVAEPALEDPAPPRARDVDDRFIDAGLILLTSIGTGAGGALVGAGVAADSDMTGDEVFRFMLVTGMIGFLAGPYVYDDLRDGRGSLIGAYAGMGVGAIAGLGLLINEQNTLTKVGAFALPLVGMGAGYALFDGAPKAVRPSALMVPDGAGGLRLQAGLGGVF